MIVGVGCRQVFRQLGITRRTPTMLASKPMAFEKVLKKIVNRWPTALVVFGVALTLLWGGLLVFLSLHLLQML